MQNPLIGHQLGNFRIEKLIGRGGMAEVYYGHDLMLHRPVAIKVIDARLRDNVTYAHRFVQEARTIAQWRHENIVQIFFAGEEEGLFYFVMEYIEGPDLSELLSQYRAEETLMAHQDVIYIGRSIAHALDFAHKNGVIHRDIKPSNVMIDGAGRVALTDFGLALDVNQGSTGSAFGSAYYVAPEQARRSSDAISQSDLYSLGVILYEMLTGVVPFDDPSPTSLALQHINMPPPAPKTLNPNLNRETETVLLKALAKSADNRYPTGKTLIEALEKALTTPSTAPPAVPKKEVQPRQSEITVQEKVDLYITQNPINTEWKAETDGEASPSPTDEKNFSIGTIAIFGVMALLLLILIIAALTSIFSNNPDTAETVPNSPTANAAIVQITETNAPPVTSMPQPGMEVSAIETSTPQPSLTPPPTQMPPPNTPTNTPIPTPTILHPDGRLVQFLYDDYSFYILNLDDQPIDIANISFEGLNDSGESAGHEFSGTGWANFYETLDSGRCNRIETTQAPFYLRPGQCTFYNATVTPTLTDGLVFWSSLNGIISFRVLWDGSEIGRCQVSKGICEVFLPR